MKFQICSCILQVNSIMVIFGLGQILMLHYLFFYHIHCLALLISELSIDDVNCLLSSRLVFFFIYHYIYEICFLCYIIFQFIHIYASISLSILSMDIGGVSCFVLFFTIISKASWIFLYMSLYAYVQEF